MRTDDAPTEGTGDDDAPATVDAQGAPTGDAPGGDAAALRAEIKALRAENARHRTDLRRHEEAAKARAAAEMTEAERLQARVAELTEANEALQRDRRREALRAVATEAAVKLGYASPADAVDAVMLAAADIEWTDAGAPRGVERLLSERLEARPHLRATFTRPPDLAQGDRGQGALTMADIRAMSQEEVDRRLPEVLDVLAADGRR